MFRPYNSGFRSALIVLLLVLAFVGCSGHVKTILWTVDYDYNEETGELAITITANPGVDPTIFKGADISETGTNTPPHDGKKHEIAHHNTANHMTNGSVTLTFTVDSNTQVIVVDIHQEGLPIATVRYEVPHHS